MNPLQSSQQQSGCPSGRSGQVGVQHLESLQIWCALLRLVCIRGFFVPGDTPS